MPLLPGKANVGKNIATEEAAGKPRKQAVAIALHVAGKGRKKEEELPGRGHHGPVKKRGGYDGY